MQEQAARSCDVLDLVTVGKDNTVKIICLEYMILTGNKGNPMHFK